jgi:hypothetical protein
MGEANKQMAVMFPVHYHHQQTRIRPQLELFRSWHFSLQPDFTQHPKKRDTQQQQQKGES